MISARQAIERARDRHAAFDRHRFPDGMALRMLSDYIADLHGKVVQRDAHAIALHQITPLPLADFAAGIVLPPNRYVADVAATVNDALALPAPVDIIPFEHRFDPQRGSGRYGWIVDGVLVLRGTGTLWTLFTSIDVTYAPVLAELVTLDDVLPLPDTGVGACAAHLAYLFACRGHADPALPPITLPAFAAKSDVAEADFLTDVSNRRTSTVIHTRDIRGY